MISLAVAVRLLASMWLLVPKCSSVAFTSNNINNNRDGIDNLITKNPIPHHVAIRTRDIERAISFYSLFGFEVQHKFRASSARAAWLTLAEQPASLRIELIEIPAYILPVQPRALDLLEHNYLLGFNHLALDVTRFCNNSTNNTLSNYITQVNCTSLEKFGKTLRIALLPKQTMIGNDVYELAFLFDADGCLLELLNYQTTLPFDYSEEVMKWWQKQQSNSTKYIR